MPLSKSCIYGLRASVYLASKKSTGYVKIRKISNELNIPFHYLTKVLQQLTNAQILESSKGPNGGIKLAIPADEITFMDVVFSITADHTFMECILGLPKCGELKPCPLHNQWFRLKENLLSMMVNSTLSELAGRNDELSVYLEKVSISKKNSN